MMDSSFGPSTADLDATKYYFTFKAKSWAVAYKWRINDDSFIS